MMGPVSGFQPLGSRALPIYSRADTEEGHALFYAPGYVAVVPSAQVEVFTRDVLLPAPGGPVAAALRYHAHAALVARKTQTTGAFRPVCLTLYLHNECNLHCTYCFAEPTHTPQERLQMPEIRAAAQLVLDHCRSRGQPFTLVCHGGGEPTLHKPLLEEALNTIEAMVEAVNLPIFRYIATNGVMSTAKARWVGQRFDLVGLSCDGPADIQTDQRPTWCGQASSAFVERTASIIREQGTPLHVRVTLLPDTIVRQVEIAHYICQKLGPAEVHVEPVYGVGRAANGVGLTLAQADLFVAEFYRAQQVARQYGVHWSTSGSRPGEIHGSYCHVFRDVLNLVPGGVVTACFQATDKGQAEQLQFDIGQFHENRFVLAEKRIATLRQRLSIVPTRCQSCFNQFHCTRACPNACPANSTSPVSDFHCLTQQKLTLTRLEMLARQLLAQKDNGDVIAGATVRFQP